MRVVLFVSVVFIGFSTTNALAACPPGNNGVCVITTGTSNTTSISGVTFSTYAWDSPTVGAKSETIGVACSSTTPGETITIKDEIGTAGTYPISVMPQSGNTIDGIGSFTLNSNFESITLQCDWYSGMTSIPNWIVE